MRMTTGMIFIRFLKFNKTLRSVKLNNNSISENLLSKVAAILKNNFIIAESRQVPQYKQEVKQKKLDARVT